MCPECGAEFTNKISYCIDCELFFLGAKSTSHKKLRCKTCAAMRIKKAKAVAWRNRDKTKKTPVKKYVFKKIQRQIVKPDCKFYLHDCLPKAAFEPKGGGVVYCNDCQHYEPDIMHAELSTKESTEDS